MTNLENHRYWKRKQQEYRKRYLENHQRLTFTVDRTYYAMVVSAAGAMGLTAAQFLKRAVDRYLDCVGKETSPHA